jgi:hypothetical protein
VVVVLQSGRLRRCAGGIGIDANRLTQFSLNRSCQLAHPTMRLVDLAQPQRGAGF